jgi:hypothetical protein
MDTKLSKIVDKSLDAVLDRVENGDCFYDTKSGTIKRRPVAMRDVARVSVDMISKRELLRGNATERREVTQVSVDEQLKALAIEFARWQTPLPKPMETLDVIATEVPEPTSREERGNLLEQTEEVDDAEFEGMAGEAGEYSEDERSSTEVEDESLGIREAIPGLS